jgi:hypothetical protein
VAARAGGDGAGVHCARPAAFSELEGSPFALRSPSRNAGFIEVTPHDIASPFYHLLPTAARSLTPPTAQHGRWRLRCRQRKWPPKTGKFGCVRAPARLVNAKGLRARPPRPRSRRAQPRNSIQDRRARRQRPNASKMEKMAIYTATRPQIQSDFMKQCRGRVPRAPA